MPDGRWPTSGLRRELADSDSEGLELGAAAEAELDRGSLGGDVGSSAGLGWRRGVGDCRAATTLSSGAGVRRIGQHSDAVTSEQEATALGRLVEDSNSASSYRVVVSGDTARARCGGFAGYCESW